VHVVEVGDVEKGVHVIVPAKPSDEEEEEEEDALEFYIGPGSYDDVFRTVKRRIKETPAGLWRGIWRLSPDDYLNGDQVIVQRQWAKSTELLIGRHSVEAFPMSFNALYEAVRDEYGWQDILFRNQKGEMITMANFVPGETLRVPQIVHRFKCNMIQFPGMSSWTTIYKRTGEEIEQWIRDQVQVDCVVYVLSRSWVP
jgi:hypothetical protein